MIEINKIHQGHVLNILKQIDDESVDCITTSPPYYGLRSYKTEPQIWLNGNEGCLDHWFDSNDTCTLCNAWRGELGLEPTFELFLQHMWMIFDEVYRILKPGGTCWINLWDSYGSGSGGMNMKNYSVQAMAGAKYLPGENGRKDNASIKRKSISKFNKSLLQIPSRFAIGMTDRGWILRNEIIWYKRNCMPSSAKDRFTVDYEKIFFFVKSNKYFFEQQFEKLSDSVIDDYRYKNPELDTTERKNRDDATNAQNGGGILTANPLGRNKRCIWDITPKGFPEAHFAVYPEELVEIMIRAGCPEEICNKCNKPKEKIYEMGFRSTSGKRSDSPKGLDESNKWSEFPRGNNNPEIIGFTDCKCNAGYHPGIILDPFIGSGTSGIVARKLNRNFIGIELQEKYIDIAERRMEKELGLFNI